MSARNGRSLTWNNNTHHSHPSPPSTHKWPLSSQSLHDLDRLPYCTSLSPQLAHALLYYRDHIQQSASSSQSHSRWLYFETVEHGANGGLADRLKGLVNVFVLALLTDRAFGIDWQYPVPITSFYQPNVLQWPSTLPLLKPHTWFEELHNPSVHHINWIGHRPDVMSVVHDTAHDVISIRANLNRFDSLWHVNDNITQRLQSFGFDANYHMDSYYSCLIQFLLRPSHQMQSMVSHQLALIGQRYMICGQIRLGSGGGGTHGFQDSRSFGTTLTTLQLIVPAIQQHITHWCTSHHNCSRSTTNNMTDNNSRNSSLSARDDYRVFITTDSQQIADRMFSYFGDRLIYNAGRIVHVDRTGADDIHAAIKVAADNWLLGYCSYGVVSASGFASLGLWRTRTHLSHPRGSFKVLNIHDAATPTLVDYIHHADGDL